MCACVRACVCMCVRMFMLVKGLVLHKIIAASLNKKDYAITGFKVSIFFALSLFSGSFKSFCMRKRDRKSERNRERERERESVCVCLNVCGLIYKFLSVLIVQSSCQRRN